MGPGHPILSGSHILATARPVVHSNLGDALAMAGRTSDAIAEFRETILDDPGDPVPHDVLGRILLRTDHKEEAGEEFEEAARLCTKDPEVYIELGFVLCKYGDYAAGEVRYRQALAIDTKNKQALRLLALAMKHDKVATTQPEN